MSYAQTGQDGLKNPVVVDYYTKLLSTSTGRHGSRLAKWMRLARAH